MSEEKKQLKNFLNELSAISNKYQIQIHGCGCCGSPMLCKIGSYNKLCTDLFYCEEDKKYYYNGYDEDFKEEK